ncbi:unnamed protein product, partial [Medioppia subpectinata]
MRDADKRTVTEWASQVANIPEASKAAARIHLFTLLFEEMRVQCADEFAKLAIIDDMVVLLEKAQHLMSVVANNKNSVITPKWLAPLILLIDLYDKAAVASARRAPLRKATKRLWKWFDDRTGRWSPYAVANNKTIDEAYKNADTLHAVMRLCLRLTRNYEVAALFAEQGGVRAILQLTQASAFTGFTSLATLIIRHVLEEPNTLRQTMERVIRMQTHHSPLACREMHYIMRVLGPAACRDGRLFIEMAKSVLRINTSPLNKREDEDPRALTPSSIQFLKVMPGKLPTTESVVPPVNITREVICDLLNALIVKSATNATEDNSQSIERLKRTGFVGGVMSSSDVLQADDNDETSNDDTNAAPETPKVDTPVVADDDMNNKKNKILLTQSLILRLLAELTRSYNLVAKAICDHIYTSGQSELISEECTALSFILDHLLPPTQTIGDRDCPALSRVLFAALASATHSPEVQQSLVNEVKSALHRTLVLSESNEKHSRIQALTSLISTMIESCPAPTTASSQQNVQNSIRSQTSLM